MIPVLRDFYTPSTLTRTCWCGWLQVIKRLCALPGSALGVVPASVQRLDIRKKEKNLEDSAVYQKEMPDLPMAPSHLESRKNNVGSKQRCRSVNVCDKFFHPRNFLFPSSSSNRARDFFLLREIHKEIVQKKWIKSSVNIKEEKEICRRDLFGSPWRKKLLGTKVGSLTITFSLSRSLSVEIATVWWRWIARLPWARDSGERSENYLRPFRLGIYCQSGSYVMCPLVSSLVHGRWSEEARGIRVSRNDMESGNILFYRQPHGETGLSRLVETNIPGIALSLFIGKFF